MVVAVVGGGGCNKMGSRSFSCSSDEEELQDSPDLAAREQLIEFVWGCWKAWERHLMKMPGVWDVLNVAGNLSGWEFTECCVIYSWFEVNVGLSVCMLVWLNELPANSFDAWWLVIT